MERLTKISEIGNAYYPKCFDEPCCGMGECLDDNCSLMIDACKKLAEYEQLEEQGLLVRLPCKLGDTVWVVTSPINVFDYDKCDGDAEYEVYESFLSSVSYYASGEQFRIYAKVTNSFIAAYFRECDFGESIFFTREEAEKKLEEMKND